MSDKKILLVDDEPDIVETVKLMLELRNYEVNVAYDGVKGIEQATKEKPNLILLDIMMPQMDGYSVCHMLKTNKKTKDIPIIMLTAKGESDAVTKSYNVGADDYIVKPFNPSTLLEKVRKWMA
jgi:DNA-binding response OmpR family regulator